MAAYFFTSIVVVAFGAFPTPVLGFGASPILGAMLGLGLLGKAYPAGTFLQLSADKLAPLH